MNKKMIIYILGKMLGVEGALLLIPALVSLIYGEKTGVSFLIVAAVLGVIFLIFGRKKPKNKMLKLSTRMSVTKFSLAAVRLNF